MPRIRLSHWTLCASLLGMIFAATAQAGTGYWDLFAVSLTPNGYYWDLAPTIGDPLVQPDPGGTAVIDYGTPLGGVAYGYGGYDWGTGTLESDNAGYQIQYAGALYLSVVLDTKTSPYHDPNYPSWGTLSVSIEASADNGATWNAPFGTNWIVSPAAGGGTVLVSTPTTANVTVGTPTYELGYQAEGIYGAGTLLTSATATDYRVTIGTDVYTWDSYRLASATGGGPGDGPDPDVIPGMGNLIPRPILVTGKEYTDTPDNHANGIVNPGQNVGWIGDGTAFDLAVVSFAGEVDAQAAGKDHLYWEAVNDDVPLIFSTASPAGDDDDGLLYQYAKYDAKGVWAAPTEINSVDPPEDVNSVELWAGQPGFSVISGDTALVSLQGDPGGVAIFNAGSGTTFLTTADLMAALGVVSVVDLDALMAWDGNLNGIFDDGDSIMFSVAPSLDFVGNEVWVWTFGSLPQFLVHGGIVWDSSHNVGDVDALEAVGGERPVPEPAAVVLLALGALALLRRRG